MLGAGFTILSPEKVYRRKMRPTPLYSHLACDPPTTFRTPVRCDSGVQAYTNIINDDTSNTHLVNC